MKSENVFKAMSYVLLITIAINLSACSGGIAIIGTPEGMRAYSDMQNGLVTNGKSSPDKPTEYFASRNTQELEETKRATAPSFLGELFGK